MSTDFAINSTPLSRRPRYLRYGVATAIIGLVWVARLLIRRLVPEETPFVLFFAAVMASGWYGGFGPALYTTLVCSFLANYFFMEPLYTVDLTPPQIVREAIFIAEGLVTSALCGQLHTARLRAESNAAEARELEKTVEQISEAEQRRIGQDLHDGLGQHLTGVAFLSKALQQKLRQEGRPEAADANTINQLVNESIRWTRDLARGLAPMDLDRGSLPESLRELARKTSRMFNVECIYEGIESLELSDDESALNLYRVAQEAVSNGVKHGKARHITIDLANQPIVGLELSIHDDGVGFDPRQVTIDPLKKGMGLLVMRYRAGVIGGRLDITPATTGGTIVWCRVPPIPNGVARIVPKSWPASGKPKSLAVERSSPII